jgi:hypothetical protein
VINDRERNRFLAAAVLIAGMAAIAMVLFSFFDVDFSRAGELYEHLVNRPSTKGVCFGG